MADMIFSDWDGSLIKNDDDASLLGTIWFYEMLHTLPRPWLKGRRKQLLSAKKHLKEMRTRYKESPQTGDDIIKESYALYGREVLSGIPMDRVINSARKYGSRAVRRLDEAFEELWEAAGEKSQIVILTAALEDGVCQVLTSKRIKSLKKMGPRPYVCIDGSLIIQNGWVARDIGLRNYDGKAERMKQIIDAERIRPGKIIYMGNDYRDEPCAGIADRFVVAPLGTGEFKQHMASKYGSNVRTPSSRPGEVYKALTMD